MVTELNEDSKLFSVYDLERNPVYYKDVEEVIIGSFPIRPNRFKYNPVWEVERNKDTLP